MKAFKTKFSHNIIGLFVFLLIASNFNANADDAVEYLTDGAYGTEFYMTFHPNHITMDNSNMSGIMIYVLSEEFATVTLEVNGKTMVKDLVPFEGASFELSPEDAQCYIKDSYMDDPLAQQVFPNRAIHIKSNKPITCSGISRFPLTTDGYQALPIEKLGTDYVVSAWNDYTPDNHQYTSFTSIIATEDNTVVDFELGGALTNYTPDPNSLDFGFRNRKIMDKGDVWVIGPKGDFNDVTGSIVRSDKPVAVVSGNYRTCVGTTFSGSRDYLIEQDLPVKYWGKEYHVTPIDGRTNYSYIRILAAEANTTVYRNGVEWMTINGVGGTENDGWISRRVAEKENADDMVKPILITADKPIAVSQFTPSAHDDATGIDPFQMNLIPVEQYGEKIAFPLGEGGVSYKYTFNYNYLNVCFLATEDGLIPDDMMYGMGRNGEVKWAPFNTVMAYSGEYFDTGVVTDGRQWKYLQMMLPDPTGTYYLKSNEPFGAYIYGTESADSYGYPISGLQNVLNDIELEVGSGDEYVDDTTPPVIDFEEECCGYFSGTITEQPNMEDGEEIPSSIAYVRLVNQASQNYTLEWENISNDNSSDYVVEWSLTVTDKTKDAFAILECADINGNTVIEVFEYTAIDVTAEHNFYNWGDVNVMSAPVSKDITFTNNTDSTITITDISVYETKDNDWETGFSITDAPSVPFTLDAFATATVTVTFTPETIEDQLDSDYELYFTDNLLIKAGYGDCLCFDKSIASLQAFADTTADNQDGPDGITGIFDGKNENELQITPNPAIQSINLNIENDIVKIKIYDLNGNLVLESIESKIDVTALPAGTYYVVANGETETRKGKFIKE
jgi:hypothetical protein